MTTGMRNTLMVILTPFFATQGVLWTGIQIILLKCWSCCRKEVDSLYDSISSFYVLGIFILLIFMPAVTLLQPMLPVALVVTLILTASACAIAC
ncbi:MAG: hypothetical protein ACI8R9_000634 [Paraglaciecola sp.]|jgi:hypothetical protein